MAILGLYAKENTGLDIFKRKSHLFTLKEGFQSPQWCYKWPLESIMLWSALISIVHCSAACCTLARKIQCKANNRFSSIILWHKNQKSPSRLIRLMSVSIIFCHHGFSEWRDFLSEIENRAGVLCIAENLGRQLNPDWKFAECCSTHFRFIWKQTRTVSGTNMPMGGKLRETSSGTIPTPMLHGISTGFRTSKSKGKKKIFFQ